MLNRQKLTKEVYDFVSRYLSRGKTYTLSEIEHAIASDAKLALGAELRALFLLSLMQNYHHDDENIQQEVRNDFANLKGSWEHLLLELMQYQTFGFVVAEKSYEVRKGKARLSRLNILDQSHCYFDGIDRQTINYVKYRQIGREIKLEYPLAVFHLANQNYLSLSRLAKGLPLATRAMPFYELSEKIHGVLAIAALKQATPLLVGKTRTADDITMYGADGRVLMNDGVPVVIKKGRDMYNSLMQAENDSVAIIDEDDEIMAIAQQTNGEFFQWVLYYLDACKLASFLISPILVGTSNSGVGDSNLADTHLTTLKVVGRTQMRIFGNELVEQIIKPCLQFNYGELDSYGYFPVPDEDNINTIELLNAISNGVRAGVLTQQDEEAIARFKELAGIGEVAT